MVPLAKIRSQEQRRALKTEPGLGTFEPWLEDEF